MKRKNNAVDIKAEHKTEAEETAEAKTESNREDKAAEFTIDSIYPEGSLNAVKHFDAERKITRPDLHLKRVLIKVVAVLIAVAICGIIAKLTLKSLSVEKSGAYAWLIASAILLAIIIVKLKSILIWLVLVYQKLAPERVRRKCVFTPSCSEYMMLSLKKYGVIKGLIKGIKRLKRCHLPNHGEDYP